MVESSAAAMVCCSALYSLANLMGTVNCCCFSEARWSDKAIQAASEMPMWGRVLWDMNGKSHAYYPRNGLPGMGCLTAEWSLIQCWRGKALPLLYYLFYLMCMSKGELQHNDSPVTQWGPDTYVPFFIGEGEMEVVKVNHFHGKGMAQRTKAWDRVLLCSGEDGRKVRGGTSLWTKVVLLCR